MTVAVPGSSRPGTGGQALVVIDARTRVDSSRLTVQPLRDGCLLYRVEQAEPFERRHLSSATLLHEMLAWLSRSRGPDATGGRQRAWTVK